MAKHDRDIKGLERDIADVHVEAEHESLEQRVGWDTQPAAAEGDARREVERYHKARKKRLKDAKRAWKRDLKQKKKDDAKFAAGRQKRLEKLRAERLSGSVDEFGFFEASAATQHRPVASIPHDPGEEHNLRMAFGDAYLAHPEAVKMRERWWNVEADPVTGELRRVPVTPHLEHQGRLPFHGTHDQLRWEATLRYFRSLDAWQARQMRLGRLRCKAPKPRMKTGERCGKPIPDAQRVTRETCSNACKQRLTAERERLREAGQEPVAASPTPPRRKKRQKAEREGKKRVVYLSLDGVDRSVLLERQGGRCRCGAELDAAPEAGRPTHVKPLPLGGRHSYDNLQLICPACVAALERQISP
jgi:hypothetical protein